MFDISQLTGIIGNVIYVCLVTIALWGLFCTAVVWLRVGQTRFRNEDAQNEFLNELEGILNQGDFNGAAALCEGDRRAMPQLALLAISQRDLGYAKLRQMVADRFQRDFLSDLEYRLSWVHTVIKSAPMIGLLGTVIGMMGAFAKIAGSTKVEASSLASDISLALITTAAGLTIAIPLVICTASINVRIRKMEDMVGGGLTRFFEGLRGVLSK